MKRVLQYPAPGVLLPPPLPSAIALRCIAGHSGSKGGWSTNERKENRTEIIIFFFFTFFPPFYSYLQVQCSNQCSPSGRESGGRGLLQERKVKQTKGAKKKNKTKRIKEEKS